MRKWLPPYQFLLLSCPLALTAGNTSAQLVAKFSSNISEGCAPFVVRYKDESLGNPTAWKWDLGNGTTSYFQNPAATYFNPGTYTIKLVVQNAVGRDSIVKVNYITVYASPIVDFIASDTGGCYPLKVQFTDRSIAGDGAIVKWLWDFGDGNIDSVLQPQHIYDDLGNYNVSLQVKNTKGCISTLTRANYIKLNNGINSGFHFNVPNNCKPPTDITFVNETVGTGVIAYEWLFGDGATSSLANPVHRYNSPGTYTVKLTARNNAGCIDSVVKFQALTIGAVKADFTAPAVICVGEQLALTNRSGPNPTAAFWDFGDGTYSASINAVKTYQTSGPFVIKLVSDFGACKDSLTKSILVLDKPMAGFDAVNPAACKPPVTTSFVNKSSGGIKYKWLFGDGDSSTLSNPIHTYNTVGTYDVVLIVTNASGCTDTLRKKGLVQVEPPRARITNLPQEGCQQFPYTPSVVVESVDSILRYQWDFGDGTIEEGKNPTHIYSAGSYSIKLIVTSVGGCTDTLFVPNAIHVGVKPNPLFSASPRYACAFQDIHFTDASTGSVDSWLWHFGDGGTSTDQHPIHIYQDTGYFNVTLIVSNNGCRDSLHFDKYIYIKPPIAKFSDSSGCGSRFTRKFIDKSIGALRWYWQFGDGSTSNDQNPVHTYSVPGAYTVTLTVSNDTCEHTIAKEVIVIAERADFVASDSIICKNVAVDFVTKNLRTANIASYWWSFGDGVNQYGNDSVRHSYAASGKYDVRLFVTDINGCVDSLSKLKYIQVDGPTAAFTSQVPGACRNQNIIFNDASTDDGTHSINKWMWRYGDGFADTLNAPPFQHTYGVAGNYNVTLKIFDSKGCVDSLVKRNSIIISQPKADFISPDTNSCTTKTIRFNNLSSGPLLTYRWDFGDGQLSTITSPVHIYNQEGLFSVNLSIMDQYGCRDSVRKTNYVSINNPVAQFSMSDSVSTCPPLVVNFTNQSQHFIAYQWDFGDGTKSALQNPVHFYTYPGIYHAKLKVVSAGGCVDSISKTIVVRGPQGSFTYDRYLGCVPTTVNFVATTKDQVSFIWDFNDGETIAVGDSGVSHTYTTMGEYLPKMILRDPQGCQVPIVGKDTIRIYGVNARFGRSSIVVCDSGFVRFRDSSISNDRINNYLWSFGDGSSSQEQHPSHWYNHTGDYPISLIVTTEHQCKDTANDEAPMRISSTPHPRIDGDTASCVPAFMHFNGSVLNPDTSRLQWRWDFGNGVTASVQQPQPVNFNAAGNYDVRLTLLNSFLCSDVAHFPIIVHPIPAVGAGPDAIICRYQQTQLQGNGAIKYAWSPSSSLSCGDCATPLARPDSTIQYVLTGENIFGCIASDTVLIGVKQPFKMKTAPGDTLCKGESFLMNVSGAELYSWSPSISLDNAASSHPKARPDTSTVYRVIGRDNKDCFSDTGFVRITVYPYPLVEAGPDQTIMGGNSVTFNPVISKDVKNIRWMPERWLSCYDCPSPVATPKQSTRFTIMVSNEGGCVAKDDIAVFVLCEEGNLFLPNTFSPNDDGINDVFYPRGKGIYGIKNFRVFDRWGEVVFSQSNFQANDITKGWNGMVRGKLASQDVYVYTIDVICENNFVFSLKGNVALIR